MDRERGGNGIETISKKPIAMFCRGRDVVTARLW